MNSPRYILASVALLLTATGASGKDLTVTTDSGTLTKTEASHNSPDYSPCAIRTTPTSTEFR